MLLEVLGTGLLLLFFTPDRQFPHTSGDIWPSLVTLATHNYFILTKFHWHKSALSSPTEFSHNNFPWIQAQCLGNRKYFVATQNQPKHSCFSVFLSSLLIWMLSTPNQMWWLFSLGGWTLDSGSESSSGGVSVHRHILLAPSHRLHRPGTGSFQSLPPLPM